MVDPRGSGLLFFMFIRPHPYTCLGIEWRGPSRTAPAPPPETRTIFSELVASSIREAEMLFASELSIYCGGLARADPDASTSIEIMNILMFVSF